MKWILGIAVIIGTMGFGGALAWILSAPEEYYEDEEDEEDEED